MNGGFGLVLDGSDEAERKAINMLNWDVSNGVARRYVNIISSFSSMQCMHRKVGQILKSGPLSFEKVNEAV